MIIILLQIPILIICTTMIHSGTITPDSILDLTGITHGGIALPGIAPGGAGATIVPTITLRGTAGIIRIIITRGEAMIIIPIILQ
jgi:hypothetical protein